MPPDCPPRGLVPPFPAKPYAAIWAVFEELSNRRPDGGFAICPITHQAITSFEALRAVSLTPFEVTAIFSLDDVFRKVMTSGDGSSADHHSGA